MNNKIFCIGLNKTGTSSLHEAFKILGLKSVHFKDDYGNDIKKIILNNYKTGNNILKELEVYDAILDWDLAPYTVDIFKEFDKQYPNSKFILNTRDLNDWLDSREKHVKRNQAKQQKNPNKKITWLKIDRKGWEIQFKKHYKAANQHFKDRENDFLVFDVTKGDDWEKLCPFLNMSIPNVAFPKNNISSQRNKPFYRKLYNKLKKYL